MEELTASKGNNWVRRRKRGRWLLLRSSYRASNFCLTSTFYGSIVRRSIEARNLGCPCLARQNRTTVLKNEDYQPSVSTYQPYSPALRTDGASGVEANLANFHEFGKVRPFAEHYEEIRNTFGKVRKSPRMPSLHVLQYESVPGSSAKMFPCSYVNCVAY